MPLLFAVTLFVSASLLFMVQPMVAKMVLPLLGGSPAVWNACMVFFQALLLLGYLYAHWVSTRYEPKKQWGIHTLVLLLPIAVMGLAVATGVRHTPIAIAESLAPTGTSSPIVSVLALLTIAIGIPFLVVSTSAPLLQKWFAATGHPSARDPYFLYAASNAGSLISLLGYPLFLEPNLTINGQAWVFGAGFAILAVLIIACGRAAANPIAVPAPANGKGDPQPAAPTEPPPSFGRKLKWVTLAFVPSSLMLGVTFHMTTDIASVPLLWVGPLALYLITFIIAFGRVPAWFRMVIGNLAPVMVLLLVFLIISGVNPGTGIQLLLYNLTFFAVALMCHYELARDRPSVAYLTEFFLLMSVGGVLGGLFNSILAPLVFPLAYEFPLVLVVACLLVPRLGDPGPAAKPAAEAPAGAAGSPPPVAAGFLADLLATTAFGRAFLRHDLPPEDVRKERLRFALDLVIPISMGLFFWMLTMLVEKVWFYELCKSIATSITLSEETVRVVLIYAVPVMICFFFVDRPLRFALCVAAILGINTYKDEGRGLVYSERSFFGILKIEEYGRYRRLVHGTTLHGTQFREDYLLAADSPVPFGSFSPWDVLLLEASLDAWNPREEPLTYYHRSGPVGAMFRELRTRKGGSERTAPYAMVGLGTGSVSAYALPGQTLTFYEIDPAVKKLVAERPDYFTYVSDAQKRGATVNFEMGDARLMLKNNADAKYNLLLVDAFSSDSIPVHLLTKEAVALYFDRVTEDGIVALHISNKYVRLEPVVGAIVEELNKSEKFGNVVARVWNDDGERRPGKTASSWVVLARRKEDLGALYSPYGDLVKDIEYSTRVQLQQAVYYTFGKEARDAVEKDIKSETDMRNAMVAWLENRKAKDPRAGLYATLVNKYGLYATLDEAMVQEHGHVFRPVRVIPDVPAWTDDYSDVLRVMMIKEVQRVRKLAGLPTPIED